MEKTLLNSCIFAGTYYTSICVMNGWKDDGMSTQIFAVIMAGGCGERFWPKSRKKEPKQLLRLLGKETLIEQTANRLKPILPADHILVITNRAYVKRIRELLPELPPEHIVGEPCARDTAPCLALAAGIVRASCPSREEALLLLLPADHAILDADALTDAFRDAFQKALSSHSMVTFGIKPSFPSPDYGYIECGESCGDDFFHVSRFREKPSVETAREFLAEGGGRFLWNSGMFVFPLSVIAGEMEKNAPDLLCLMNRIQEAWGTPRFETVLECVFSEVRKISIDYAIMEHSKHILVRKSDFGWDDIGNWTALRNHYPADENGNVVIGRAVLQNCRNCIVFTEEGHRLAALSDLDGMVVVLTPDVSLMIPADRTPGLKSLLKKLSAMEGGETFL